MVARRGALLRTAYLLTGNHHDAEDLVQSALIKVVPKWKRIKDRPEPYVRQVLARDSVSRWRGRRWREVSTDVVPEATHHDSTDRIESARGPAQAVAAAARGACVALLRRSHRGRHG